MACNCVNCKYYLFEDVYWNGQDEEIIYVCEKKHNKFLEQDNIECPYFKKYKPKHYVEKFTECDNCEYVSKCEISGYVIESTIRMDNYRHFIKGRNCYCEKEMGNLKDKKISEIIAMANLLNIDQTTKINLKRIMEHFGNITYKQLMEDKKQEIADFLFASKVK